MKKGYQDNKLLFSLLETMCQRVETDSSIPKEFDISNLLTTEEWEITTTNYGHITLGQLFCSRVESNKVKYVSKTGKKSKKGLTQYRRE